MSEEIDVEALYNTAMGDSTSGEIPMSNETPEAPPVETAPVQELEFNYKGKQIKTRFDDPKVKQWVSQGYDYAQLMESFNKEKSEFEKQRATISEIEKTYKPIDEWAKQNPEKWNALFTQWKETSTTSPQAQQLPPEVLQKLEKYDQVIQRLEEREKSEIIQKEDQALEGEIKSIREKYPNIDFDAPTHDGKSLEYRVLEHASKNGIKSFKTSFVDFYHDNLVKFAEEKGKETVSKDIQKKTKLGLLKTSAPAKQLSHNKDVRGMSYDDILNEVKSEFNIN